MNKPIESQIFQIMDDMEEYIGSCRYKMLSSTEIIVNKEKMDVFLREMRRKAPEEIDMYRRVIENSQSIVRKAQQEAQTYIDDAMAQTNQMLSENEIKLMAQREADQIVQMATETAQQTVDDAQVQANNLIIMAKNYLEDAMNYLEELLNSSSQIATANYENLIRALQEKSAQIQADHKQLHPEEDEVQENAPADDSQE